MLKLLFVDVPKRVKKEKKRRNWRRELLDGSVGQMDLN